MIYFSGLDSIVESLYLEESLGDKLGSSKIFINPVNISYLTGKVIIINQLRYPQDSVATLINNGNKVISRIKFTDFYKEVNFEPYILRPDFNLMWGGDEIEIRENEVLEGMTEKLLDKILESCSFISDRQKLFFPKLKGNGVNHIAIDSENNLTFIGYALQQVGVNIVKTNTPFLDLDILKTKKLNF